MPTHPVPERFGASEVREALELELEAGRWSMGERLPTERDLGTRFGVARNTVRRALGALEARGLIHRHIGRGTFRAAAPAVPGERAGEEALSPADVLECRLIFEPEMLSLAVSRANQADIARMTECLRSTDEATDLAGFERWDAALHDAFALGTHNGGVIAMSRSLARVREQTDWGQLKARGNTAERRVVLQGQHRAMVDAVRQRDRVEARRVMRDHILFVQSYMFGDWSRTFALDEVPNLAQGAWPVAALVKHRAAGRAGSVPPDFPLLLFRCFASEMPSWRTVPGWFRRWQVLGVFERTPRALARPRRRAAGRKPVRRSSTRKRFSTSQLTTSPTPQFSPPRLSWTQPEPA